MNLANLDANMVIAGVMAIVILVDISILWVMGKPVPELLGYLASSVFGYYFGRGGKSFGNHNGPEGTKAGSRAR